MYDISSTTQRMRNHPPLRGCRHMSVLTKQTRRLHTALELDERLQDRAVGITRLGSTDGKISVLV